MALLIQTGVAGTGKTLFGIQKYIIPELKTGGVVYTNIDGLVAKRISILFDIDIFQIEKNLRILKDPEYFYKELEKNSMCVIDEAQNVFNNREWQSEKNSECIKYLMEHRHYGHKLVFITPHIDSLDAGIRRVAEFTYKHKSFSALGNAKTVKCAIFDQCNLQKGPLQTFQWRHDTRIYDCYRSYFEEGTKEKKERVYPLRNTLLIMIVIFTLITSFFAIKNGLKFAKRFEKKEKVYVQETKQETNKKPIIKSVNTIKINGETVYER